MRGAHEDVGVKGAFEGLLALGQVRVAVDVETREAIADPVMSWPSTVVNAGEIGAPDMNVIMPLRLQESTIVAEGFHSQPLGESWERRRCSLP